MPSTAPVTPLQFTQLTTADLANPATFNTIFSQIFSQVNSLIGASGTPTMAAGVNVAGATVQNVGEPQSPSDAISKGHAEANYSAPVLAQQLEAGGSATLKTFRALNSQQQSEKYSTFLNQLSNTAPTTNTTTVQAVSSGAGAVTFTVPAGYHLRVDGSSQPFGTFTATVPAPTSQTVASATRAGGISTLSGAFSGLYAGESVNVTGVSDSSFNVTAVLLSASGTTVTYSQPGQPNVTTPATGGKISTQGCYFLYLKYPSQQLALSGPFPSDSQQNRLEANIDGQCLIAVVVVDASGLVADQTAAGATPVAATGNFRVISRL